MAAEPGYGLAHKGDSHQIQICVDHRDVCLLAQPGTGRDLALHIGQREFRFSRQLSAHTTSTAGPRDHRLAVPGGSNAFTAAVQRAN